MKKHQHRQQSVPQVQHELRRLKGELALLAPPKVENRMVVVEDIYTITRNSNLSLAGNESQYSFSGNGVYKTTTTPGVPIYDSVPQQDQLDLAFREFKYWTPMEVEIHWYPILNQTYTTVTGAQGVRDLPTITVKDLDLEIQSLPLSLSAYAAKGQKTFQMHPAQRGYDVKYPDLDRLCMQKQQKSMFLTNGKWANREQLKNPACIQWLGFDPVIANPTILGFMKVKLRVRVSDRVAPGTEQLAKPVVVVEEQPQQVGTPFTNF